MNRRTLGRTDLSVTPLCLGGNVFGWTADERSSGAVLDAYLEGGGNFIDTADTYAQGESERILGRWMHTRNNRSRVILATKVGMGTYPHGQPLSRRTLMEAVEASFRSSPAHCGNHLQWQHAIRVELHEECFDLPIKVGRLLFAHALPGTMTPGMQALDEVIDRLQERNRSRLLLPISVKQTTRL